MAKSSYFASVRYQRLGADGERLAEAHLTLDEIHARIVRGAGVEAATRRFRDWVRVHGADAIKRARVKLELLPAVTLGGEFRAYGNEYLTAPSGIIQYDLDSIAPKDAPEVIDALRSNPHIALAFRSPSGKVKAAIRVNPIPQTPAEHLSASKQIRERFDSRLGLESDKGVGSISKLCFLVNDPQAYRNADSALAEWDDALRVANAPLRASVGLADPIRRYIKSALSHLAENCMAEMLLDRDNCNDFVLRYLKAWGMDAEARTWYEYGARVADGGNLHRAEPFDYYYARTTIMPDSNPNQFFAFAHRFGWDVPITY